jgi:hypothetical protein
LLGYAGHFDDKVIDAVRRHPDVSHNECSTSPTSPVTSWSQTRLSDDSVSVWSWLAPETPAFHWLVMPPSLILSTLGLTYLSHRLNTLSKIRKSIRWRMLKPSRMRPGA